MQWPLPWIRASLDLAVLGCVLEGPLHGYGIAVQLELRGFGRPKGGSLYPVLSRLEDTGYVQARWEQADTGPGRKSYSITHSGRQYLSDGLIKWQTLTEALSSGKDNRS
ncbi:PadR family transcriptional regulator [uncultured Arthrobacter sp.]|nr:PadR family transcriptional regulator [uncultured Arthrobacter sp.]